ncbi:MAG: VanZ family protein [Pseudolysinimonas sp.]
MFRHHPILTVVTFVYLGVVGWITLGPQPLDEGADSLVWRLLHFFSRFSATDWVTYSLLEFWANVAMFVPVGLFFVLLLGRRRWWLAIGLGILLTCAIEFVQMFLPDRVSDPRDIVANSVGALVGVVIALVVTWPAAVRRARERRLEARTA